MRQTIPYVLAAAILFVSSYVQATTQSPKELTLKKPLVKEDLTQGTRAVKKAKAPKISQKAKVKKRAPASDMQIIVKHNDKKATKKLKKGKALADKKSNNKKYWSVECRQGFIKDSYVYCARKTASVPVSKKPVMKKLMAKKAKASVRK